MKFVGCNTYREKISIEIFVVSFLSICVPLIIGVVGDSVPFIPESFDSVLIFAFQDSKEDGYVEIQRKESNNGNGSISFHS